MVEHDPSVDGCSKFDAAVRLRLNSSSMLPATSIMFLVEDTYDLDSSYYMMPF